MNNAYIRAQQCKVKEAKFPFVKIGEQYWTKRNLDLSVTPQGNTIPEVQSNATWATSQSLYDNTYAATSGTVEQKTYAAVKAAAMWSNYANNPTTGGIYGKLYNWFAVKLFQMDIDYYNAANPYKKWASGFRMPTLTEFQTLSTYLGGNTVSGGKLKEAGLAHWSSPNTGADNSSGLTILPSGMRSVDGSFIAVYTNFRAWQITETNSTNSKRILIDYDSPTSIFSDGDKRLGCSIRLIKA